MGTLQFISHRNERYGYAEGCRLALEGGCRWIQLRMKGYTDDEVRPVALEVKRMCREHGATLIIDDRVRLAMEVHANGVHLGKGDMPIREARRVLGPHAIIGGTANTIDDVRTHWRDGASYIGCGPFRFTTTKEHLSPLLGIDGYRAILEGMRREGIRLPLVAIGGITPNDIPMLLGVGVDGVAMSGAILGADDPIEEVGKIMRIIHTFDNH